MINRICMAVVLACLAVAGVQTQSTVWSATMTVGGLGTAVGYNAFGERGALSNGTFTWGSDAVRVILLLDFLDSDDVTLVLADTDCPVGTICGEGTFGREPFPFVLSVAGYGDLDLRRADPASNPDFDNRGRGGHRYEWRHGMSGPDWTWTEGETIRVSLIETTLTPTPVLPVAGAALLAALLAAGGRRRLASRVR